MFSTMLYVTFASYIKPNSVKLIKYVKKLRTYSEPRLASWVLNFLIILSLISWFYVKSSRIMEHVQGLMPWLTRGTHLTQLARWFLPHLCPAFGTSPISALLSVSSPSGERKDACGLRKWCKLLVLKFYWSPRKPSYSASFLHWIFLLSYPHSITLYILN